MSKAVDVRLEASWLEVLLDEFEKGYMRQLRQFLIDEKAKRKIIYPRGQDYFKALDQTPFRQVRVVILGQDPYHGPGQAHGLCFSVPHGVRSPPSLRNICREIVSEYPEEKREFGHGNLEGWATQGVLLLNSVLTVEQARAGSHQGKGWEQFTDRIVAELSGRREGLVFMLWGRYAQNKGQVIDGDRHLVLESAHPSPLSAHNGFVGNNHFRKCNDYLVARSDNPIDWFAL